MTEKPPQLPGFSLGSKLIFFAALGELVVVATVLYLNYTYLVEQRTVQFKNLLALQVENVRNEWELQSFHQASHFAHPPQESALDPEFQFQILDDSGHVYWDSVQPKRIHTQMLQPHPMIKQVQTNGVRKGLVEFSMEGSHEPFLGAFEKWGEHVYILGAISQNTIRMETAKVMERFLYVSLFFSGLTFILIVFYTRSLLRPIQQLTYASQKISSGEFEFELETPSKDEIGVLSQAFSTMAQRVRDLLNEEIQKVRIEGEVNTVADLQRTFLPENSIRQARFEIQSHYESASEAGGDYWGYFQTDQDLVLYVADATGHGLPSAMLTSTVKGCFSALERVMKQKPDFRPLPSEILRFVHNSLTDSAQDDPTMTMFIAVYHLEDGTIHYANAGHSPAWILRPEKIEVLQFLGSRLGDSEEFSIQKDGHLKLQPGDTLFLYSDGVLDCQNTEREAFGKNRLKDFFLQQLKKPTSLEALKNSTVDEIHRFIQNQPLQDDFTFALVKINEAKHEV